MTPEQLDKIEKEARAGGPEDDGAGDIAAFLVDCRILPLVKALREALARCETLRELADEKAHAAGLYARRMERAQIAGREARAERDKYKAALDAELPAAWREDIESLNSCLERIGKERDEARAEVERLRSVLRKVHAWVKKGRDWNAVEAIREIHKITKGMVE